MDVIWSGERLMVLKRDASQDSTGYAPVLRLIGDMHASKSYMTKSQVFRDVKARHRQLEDAPHVYEVEGRCTKEDEQALIGTAKDIESRWDELLQQVRDSEAEKQRESEARIAQHKLRQRVVLMALERFIEDFGYPVTDEDEAMIKAAHSEVVDLRKLLEGSNAKVGKSHD